MAAEEAKWTLDGFLWDKKATPPVPESPKENGKEDTAKTENPAGESTTDTKPADTTTSDKPADKTEEPTTESKPIKELIKGKTDETEINTIIDQEIEVRTKAGKSKEDVISEINKELKQEEDGKEGLDFNPFYDLLHKNMGYDDLKEEDRPENSIDGFVDHIRNIIESNSRPQYSSNATKEFDDYVKGGGDPKHFWDVMYGDPDYENMKADSEVAQKTIMDLLFKAKNPTWDATKRAEKIEKLVETEQLEEDAKDGLDELKRLSGEKKVFLTQEKEQRRATDIQRYENWKSGVHTFINNSKTISGFEVNENDKKGFYKYMTEVGDDNKTSYGRDMEVSGSSLDLAYLKYKKINADSLKEKSETDILANIRKSMTRFSDTNKTTGTGPTIKNPEITKPETNSLKEFLMN